MANERSVAELVLRLKDEVSGSSSKIERSLGSLQGSLGGLARFAATGLGVGAVIGFGKGIIDLAGHLQDLSEQTGISAQTLSGIKSVLEESGTSVDAFAKGIFTAQKNLGQVSDESDQTALAVKALGLNLAELRTATPERFLELITGALGKIEDPIRRSALGAALLGRSAKELAPALSQMAGHLDELRRSGLSDADIKRLRDYRG